MREEGKSSSYNNLPGMPAFQVTGRSKGAIGFVAHLPEAARLRQEGSLIDLT